VHKKRKEKEKKKKKKKHSQKEGARRDYFLNPVSKDSSDSPESAVQKERKKWHPVGEKKEYSEHVHAISSMGYVKSRFST